MTMAADLARYDRAWWILRRTAGLLARVLLRPRVIGRRNIPAAGPVLIVSNHESWWDIPALGVSQPRTIRYMAKRELYDHIALAWLLRWGGAFAVRRGAADRDALRSVHETLEAGGPVGRFTQRGGVQSSRRLPSSRRRSGVRGAGGRASASGSPSASLGSTSAATGGLATPTARRPTS